MACLRLASSVDLDVAAAIRALSCEILSLAADGEAEGGAGVDFSSFFFSSAARALAAATAALMSGLPPVADGVVGRGEPLLDRDLLFTTSSSSGNGRFSRFSAIR